MQAIVLAAGEGKRLSPLTDTISKGMLSVNGRPMLEIILSQLRVVKVEEVVVVVGRSSERIKEHLGDGGRLGMRLSYVMQAAARGTADALRLAGPKVTTERFLVLPCDAIFESGLLAEMLTVESDGVVAVHREADAREHSVVITDGPYVRRNVDKSDHPPSNLASMGVYMFPQTILDACNSILPGYKGELRLPDAINWLIDRGAKLEWREAAFWLDIGTVDRYREAQDLARRLGL